MVVEKSHTDMSKIGTRFPYRDAEGKFWLWARAVVVHHNVLGRLSQRLFNIFGFKAEAVGDDPKQALR